MTEKRLAGIVMLAYPAEVRIARGDEMLSTALDASKGSPWLLLRETLALLRSGLRARASATVEAGTRRLAAKVCAQAATVWGIVLLTEFVRFDKLIYSQVGSTRDEVLYLAYQVLLVIALAAALVGYDRISAVLGLAWIGAYLAAAHGGWDWRGFGVAHWFAVVVVPLVGYIVMLIAPRARGRDARRLAWLAVVLIGLVPPELFQLGYGLGPLGMILLVLLLAGLFMLPAGSTLPLAFALALIGWGLGLWTRPGGFALTEWHSLRWAMITAGPVLLMTGSALRLLSARRRLAS
jgi:hypothetical protein